MSVAPVERQLQGKPYLAYKDSSLPWLSHVPAHWQELPGFAAYRERQVKNRGMIESTVLSLSYGKSGYNRVLKLRTPFGGGKSHLGRPAARRENALRSERDPRRLRLLCTVGVVGELESAIPGPEGEARSAVNIPSLGADRVPCVERQSRPRVIQTRRGRLARIGASV